MPKRQQNRQDSVLLQATMARDGRREGDEIRFRCPHPERHANGDADPSARYHPGKRAWFCDVCNVGGGWRELCRLLSIPVRQRARAKSKVTATYDYRNEEGELLRRKLRWEPGFGGDEKSFTWQEPDGKGGWSKSGGNGNPRVLYRSERLPAARETGSPVLVVEGEKDVDQAAALGLIAVCNPEGAAREGKRRTSKGKWNAKYSKQLRGLEVAVIADRDSTGRAHARTVAASLGASAVPVRLLEMPGEGVKDLSDWVAVQRREGRDDAESADRLSALIREAPEWKPETPPAFGDAEILDEPEDDQPKETQSEILLRIAEKAGIELFHDLDTEAFARVPVGEHHEVWAVRSRDFRNWLLHRYYLETGKAPGSQPRQDALNTLEARAKFEGKQHEIFTRVAALGSTVYLDLCNADWEVVEVTASGWRVIREAPVRFRRTSVMRPLPRPVAGGSLTELGPLVNVTDGEFVLLVSFLVAALGSEGPFPVLILNGEHGSAKSTVERIVIWLIDPSGAPLRTTPGNERDLMIAASNCRLLAFDNLSGLRPWFSDALCRLSTGGGFSTRGLFTNSDEIVFWAMRPVVLNGIDEVIGRQDLIDRSLVLTPMTISEEERRTEKDLWQEAEALRPRLLGALLNAVSCALRRRDHVHLDRAPRMADFAHFVVAAEPALPWPEGTFLAAYQANRGDAVEASLESDEVAVAIRELVAEGDFEGTAKELLAVLRGRVPEETRKTRSWPKSPRGLSARLRRAAPALRICGTGVILGLREPGTGARIIRLTRRTRAADRHDRHDRHEVPRIKAPDCDDVQESVAQCDASKNAQTSRPSGLRDGCDERDASFPHESKSADEDVLRLRS